MTSQFERDYNGRAMRAVKRIIDLVRSEPQPQDPTCTCSTCELVDNSPTGSNKAVNAWIMVVCIVLGTLILLIKGCESPAHASPSPLSISGASAVNAIIGEAENQGFVGMLAVAHAIRNRGTLKGVYGLNAKRVIYHRYSIATYNMAKRAWEQSALDYDITRKATGWGNASDLKSFAKCKWWRNCTVTFMYKSHYFYKRII